MSFLDIVAPLLDRGLPLTPLKPRSKIAFLPEWEKNPITTIEQAKQIVTQYGNDLNCGVVAKAEPGGVAIFEVDDPNIQHKIREETGQTLPVTYIIRSSLGRGHFYLRHTPESIQLGNLSADDENGKELWSFRARDQYVVSEKSVHPKTGEPYEARSVAPIAEVPSWLISWMKKQKTEKKQVEKKEEVFAEGSRNKSLASMAGKLRHSGLNYDEIEAALMAANQSRCIPPLSDDEVRTIAASIAKYEKGPENTVLVGGQPAGQTAYGVEPAKLIKVEELEELPPIAAVRYPEFPRWVLDDMSITKGLIDPFCSQNSRYPEFMLIPSLVLLLNYLGNKVRIKGMESIPLSIYTVLIGRKGRVLKSSCVQDCVKYFEYMGLTAHCDPSVRNAEGRSMVFSVGSPEGLGREMARTSCKNGVMLFDELSSLTNKANIENSNFTSSLLTLYESNKFGNTIKSSKESYLLLPGEYCASLIACSTDTNFQTHWCKLAGKTTGLDDRFFFLLQPETLIPLTEFRQAYTQEGALETRKLVDKAVQQGSYEISDHSPLRDFLKNNDDANRSYLRAVKFALAFAIDLGCSEVDPDSLERGLALSQYESDVKRYLQTYESVTKEGAIQQEIVHFIVNNGGSYPVRDLERKLHSSRYGTTLWNAAYQGLLRHGWCREEGNRSKGSPRIVRALRLPQEED